MVEPPLMSMELLQIWTKKKKLCFAPNFHFTLSLAVEIHGLQARLARKTRSCKLRPASPVLIWST